MTFKYQKASETDLAFLITGEPNSEMFLSDLRELIKRVWFFVVSKMF